MISEILANSLIKSITISFVRDHIHAEERRTCVQEGKLTALPAPCQPKIERIVSGPGVRISEDHPCVSGARTDVAGGKCFLGARCPFTFSERRFLVLGKTRH